jgi:hypothetical protein
LAAGVVVAAAGFEAGVAVAPAAAFFECFFAGVAEASGLGLGVVSAARTRGTAAKAAITISIIRERMLAFLGNLIAFGKAFIPASNRAEIALTGSRHAVKAELRPIRGIPW